MTRRSPITLLPVVFACAIASFGLWSLSFIAASPFAAQRVDVPHLRGGTALNGHSSDAGTKDARGTPVSLLPMSFALATAFFAFRGLSSSKTSSLAARKVDHARVPRLSRGAGVNVDAQIVSTKQLNVHVETDTTDDSVVFRQNFAETSEIALNQQVKMELDASHQYLAMAAFFDRADVALPGFKAYFAKASEEEREHAEKFIEFINLRGGTYAPMPVAEPERTSWSSALDAMKHALTMEMQVNNALLKLHAVSDEASDPQLCDFIESTYLTEQVEASNSIAKIIRKLMRAEPGLGVYEVDKDMMEMA